MSLDNKDEFVEGFERYLDEGNDGDSDEND